MLHSKRNNFKLRGRVSPYVLSLLMGVSSLNKGLVDDAMAQEQKPVQDLRLDAQRTIAQDFNALINWNNLTLAGGKYNPDQKQPAFNPVFSTGTKYPKATDLVIHAASDERRTQARYLLAALYKLNEDVYKFTGKRLIDTDLSAFKDPTKAITPYQTQAVLLKLKKELNSKADDKKELTTVEFEALRRLIMPILGRSPNDLFPTSSLTDAQVRAIHVNVKNPEAKLPEPPPVALKAEEPKKDEKKGDRRGEQPPVVVQRLPTFIPVKAPPTPVVSDTALAEAQQRFERSKESNEIGTRDSNVDREAFISTYDGRANQLYDQLRSNNSDTGRRATVALANYYFLAPVHRTAYLDFILSATNAPQTADAQLAAAQRFYETKAREYSEVVRTASSELSKAETSIPLLPLADRTNPFGREELRSEVRRVSETLRPGQFRSFRHMYETYDTAIVFANSVQAIVSIYATGMATRSSLNSVVHSLTDLNWSYAETSARPTKGKRLKPAKKPLEIKKERSHFEPADYVLRVEKFFSEAASAMQVQRLQFGENQRGYLSLAKAINSHSSDNASLRESMRREIVTDYKYGKEFAGMPIQFVFSIGAAERMIALARGWIDEASRTVGPSDTVRSAEIRQAQLTLAFAERELRRKADPREPLANERYAGNAVSMALNAVRILYPTFEALELLQSNDKDYELDGDAASGLVRQMARTPLTPSSPINPFTSLLARSELTRRDGTLNLFVFPVAPNLAVLSDDGRRQIPREQMAIDEVASFVLVERERLALLNTPDSRRELAELETLISNPSQRAGTLISILDQRISRLRSYLNEPVSLPGGKQIRRYELTLIGEGRMEGYKITDETKKYLWYIRSAQTALADAETLKREYEKAKADTGDVNSLLRGRVSIISAIRMLEGAADGDILRTAATNLQIRQTQVPKPVAVNTDAIKIVTEVKIEKSGPARIATIDSITIDGKSLGQFGSEFRASHSGTPFSFTTYFIFIANDTEVRDSSGKTVAEIRTDPRDGQKYAFTGANTRLFKVESDGSISPITNPDGTGDFALLRTFGQPTIMKLDGTENKDDLVASTTGKPGDNITVRVITAKRSL